MAIWAAATEACDRGKEGAPVTVAAGPSAAGTTLLEAALPYRALSLIAKADRRAVDPVYASHRWWARRPPGIMRALLLASTLPASADISEFWEKYAAAHAHLAGTRVHDMFAGGGAVLVEAARLGATPSGTDVDPLAVEIVRHELQPPDEESLRNTLSELTRHLQEKLAHLFPSVSSAWTPLHYFYLHMVECPKCGTKGPLHRKLIIARDVKKNGGVVRNSSLVAFCPACFRIHGLQRADQEELRCCGRRKLCSGTVENGKYVCPSCGARATYEDLQAGCSPRRLIAVEETSDELTRRIRAPRKTDLLALAEAEEYVVQHKNSLELPNHILATDRIDRRPVSYGLIRVTDLFTARQLALFGTAFSWINSTSTTAEVRRASRLALSNALTTNNRLCSYATDYGRLAPLFSVRSYSLPWLAVELNPLHPTGGRGTLARIFRRAARSVTSRARRHVWSLEGNKPVAQEFAFPRFTAEPDVRCMSATEPLVDLSPVNVCLFDPPYFDYIAYSELSEFYRAWHRQRALCGDPLLPKGTDPADSFGRELATCLDRVLAVLRPNRPLTFTFHSLSEGAWEAIGIALDVAQLVVTAVWPVLTDSHMGHHGAVGNCEWDLVVVCRRGRECAPAVFNGSVDGWAAAVRPLMIKDADRRCMKMAVQTLEN